MRLCKLHALLKPLTKHRLTYMGCLGMGGHQFASVSPTENIGELLCLCLWTFYLWIHFGLCGLCLQCLCDIDLSQDFSLPQIWIQIFNCKALNNTRMSSSFFAKVAPMPIDPALPSPVANLSAQFQTMRTCSSEKKASSFPSPAEEMSTSPAPQGKDGGSPRRKLDFAGMFRASPSLPVEDGFDPEQQGSLVVSCVQNILFYLIVLQTRSLL